MGVILIIVGALYLGSNLGWIPQISFRNLWPLILIAAGIPDMARDRSGRFPLFGVAMTTVIAASNLTISAAARRRRLWVAFN